MHLFRSVAYFVTEASFKAASFQLCLANLSALSPALCAGWLAVVVAKAGMTRNSVCAPGRGTNRLIFALWLAGCAARGPGVPLAHSDKATVVQELDTRTDWQGKRVAVEGYVFLPGDSAEEAEGMLELALYTKPLGAGDRLLNFQVRSGTAANQVHLPTVGKGKSTGYKTTSYQVDLGQSKVTLVDGSAHDLKTKVMLSGTVEYVPLMGGGFSHMEDPMHKGVQLYPFRLQSVQLELAR